MAYSELIKNFERVRDYMRQFFIFGFKSRNEFDKKSARSYDNEKRRIESWLSDYMSFRQDASGKNVFISVDSRSIETNPLYKAFKAKSFTTGDIIFHFYLLDLLQEGRYLSVKEIVDGISEYLMEFPETAVIDESSIRKKLREYVSLGVIESVKEGRELKYGLPKENINLESFRDCIDFYAEENPLGVIGSALSDRFEPMHNFRFKHRYIMHALDSDILYQLLEAIRSKCITDLTVLSRKKNARETYHSVVPYKIYVSTQTGRQYLLGLNLRLGKFDFLRIDAIRKVDKKETYADFDELAGRYEKFAKHVWGTSVNNVRKVVHLDMYIHASRDERYIVDRLNRERHNGTVTKVGEETYLYSVDCFDASVMKPWIKTFIGRIEKLECSDQQIVDDFYADIDEMKRIYEGGSDDF